jgi:ParB family transcriptional regulator, chromosome partitioning protein
MAKQFGLGKGLEALIPEPEIAQAVGGEGADGVRTVPVDRLRPNPDQPRRTFDEAALAELANSLRSHGVIQPILVEDGGEGSYLIVAGERRYRAARLAGLEEVPVIVRSFDPKKRLEIALIENVQREDLNAVEEAEAYRSLMSLGGRSQEDVADAVGKSRSAVANALRLLKLPEPMLGALKDGSMTAGHARAILSVIDPGRRDLLFARVVAEGLSVREAESAAADLNSPPTRSASAAKHPDRPKDPELAQVEERLIEALGTKVAIKGDAKKGTIAIEYYSLEDLERILDVLGR